MKILFVSENYFPDVSGVPVVVRYLAEGLFKRGHSVSVVCKCFKNEPVNDIINGINVYRFNLIKDWKHSYKGDISSFINFVQTFDAELLILECSECITTDILLPHIDTLNKKIIFHSHGFSGLELQPFKIKGNFWHTIGNTYNWLNAQIYYKSIFKGAVDNFNATMCLSSVDSSKDYLTKYSKQCHILDNAADEMFFSQDIESSVLDKYAKLNHEFYCISCANYTFVKNQKEILTQFYASSSSTKMSLVCIGSMETDYYKKCLELKKKLESEYGKRDVHLLCGVERKDIPSIIKGAYLYLVTSRYEQYSISIIEAMSQGIPFISVNTGNARILPGGITVDDVAEIKNKIDELMSNKELYAQLSKNGRKFAFEKCRISKVVEKLENIIKEI